MLRCILELTVKDENGNVVAVESASGTTYDKENFYIGIGYLPNLNESTLSNLSILAIEEPERLENFTEFERIDNPVSGESILKLKV